MKTIYLVTALAFILFGYGRVAAQSDYVVTPTGDTLKGKISINMPSPNSAEQITLRGADGKRKTLRASQFVSFTDDSVTYYSVIYNNRIRIMKLSRPGKYLKLYTFRGETHDFSNQLLYKNARDAKELSSIGFRRMVNKFLRDCPGIDDLDDKMFKRSGLPQLVDYYNDCRAAAAVANKTVAPDKTQPVARPSGGDDLESKLLGSIREKVAAQESSNTELLTLIDDITQKVQNKEKVPSYLVMALKEQTASLDSIREEIGLLIKLLTSEKSSS